MNVNSRHGAGGWTILPLAPIHENIVSGRLTGAPLIDPVPVRRLVLSYPADCPVPRLARLAGETITTIFNDYLESGIWVGQLLNGK